MSASTLRLMVKPDVDLIVRSKRKRADLVALNLSTNSPAELAAMQLEIGTLTGYSFIAGGSVTLLDVGVPVGFWRSVAASQNMFAYESFFDELAHARRMDPASWRRHMLGKSSRELRVLDAVLELTRWATPAPAGRFRGIGLVKANGSIVANVVEISVSDGTRIRIQRVTTAIDCGIVVNPNSVRAQVEGCVGFALSAAMYGDISVKNGGVEQSNFHDYRPIRMHEMPPVEVIILPSREAPGGAGEEAVSPFAPALANALYAATGRRIRDLPLARSGFTLG
jgi:isoquinoline 1-oxidoreductase beta subunit